MWSISSATWGYYYQWKMKTMKNAFYFIYKAFFVHEMLIFLYFRPPIFFSLSVIALKSMIEDKS